MMKTREMDRVIDHYPDVLYPDEVKAILGIGNNTLYKILQSGELKSLRIGKQYRIPKNYLLQFIDSKY